MTDANGVIVVTGAAGALGGAICDFFCAKGAHVVGVDRSHGDMAGLSENTHRETANLADPDDVESLFGRIEKEHGRPTAVVHTVGMYRGGTTAESDPSDFDLLMEVNVKSAWLVSRAAAQRMDTGAIVHVAAKQGLEASKGASAYSLSKAALVHLVKVLDAELRQNGIRVNAIVPGVIDTPANRESLPESVMKHAVAPHAIAKVIAFLASDDAAPVVGAVIPVYGTA